MDARSVMEQRLQVRVRVRVSVRVRVRGVYCNSD